LSHGNRTATARVRLTAERDRCVSSEGAVPNGDRDDAVSGRTKACGEAAAPDSIGIAANRRTVDGGGLAEEADCNGEVVGSS
jgi:hypothetical protein